MLGALTAMIVGMMFVERLPMAGALPLQLQEVVLFCLANDSDASLMAEASILVGLGDLEKASLTKGVEEGGVIPVVRAIAVGSL